jgi:hypothetical protein
MSTPWSNALNAGIGVLLLLAVPGCALFTCKPMTVIVAEKDERVRLERAPGIETTETGSVKETDELRRVGTYRIRSEEGVWYRVSPEAFRAAQVGKPIEVCR